MGEFRQANICCKNQCFLQLSPEHATRILSRENSGRRIFAVQVNDCCNFFRNARPTFQEIPGISHEGSQGTPEESKGRQRTSQGVPKRGKRSPRRVGGSPLASHGEPKEFHGALRGAQRKPIYTKTPDQPPHAADMLLNHINSY